MLGEILRKCGSMDICEQRSATDEYIELVFLSDRIDEWDEMFGNIFGPALKPAGVEPDKEILRLTEVYGGIYDNQTLFKKDFDRGPVIAMFWPWEDNVHITVKVIILDKEWQK